jgi:hypothetical protein
MDQLKQTKESKAEYRKSLFKKYNALFSTYRDTADFKEPILILMRRTQKAEFFENATQGEFQYDHSDGTKRTILLTTRQLQTFEYGKKQFKGYVCHEDIPTPLPTEPEITVESVGIAIDKTLNDIKKWKSEEARATGDMYFKIALGICAIGGLYILYRMLIPQGDGGIAETVASNLTENSSVVGETIVRNVTIFT